MAQPNDEQLVAELELKATNPPTGPTIYDLLDRQRTGIEKALPNVGLTAEQLVRVIQTQLRNNEQLSKCTPQSLLGAVMLTAQLGLEPGPLGQVYLIPFRNNRTDTLEVQFIIGYKGLIALAYRGSGVLMNAYEVRERDEFNFNPGTGEVSHTYKLGQDRGEIIGFWSKAVFPDGRVSAYAMSKADVDKHRQRSAAKTSGPWVTDYDAMGRKTVLRVHIAQLPLASNAMRAAASDETALSFDDVEGVIAATEQAPIVDVEAEETMEADE
jgi:recombination protein RecT